MRFNPSMGLGASPAIHGRSFITFGVTLSHPSFASLTVLHPATPSLACRSSLKLLNPQFPGGSHPSAEGWRAAPGWSYSVLEVTPESRIATVVGIGRSLVFQNLLVIDAG